MFNIIAVSSWNLINTKMIAKYQIYVENHILDNKHENSTIDYLKVILIILYIVIIIIIVMIVSIIINFKSVIFLD